MISIGIDPASSTGVAVVKHTDHTSIETINCVVSKDTDLMRRADSITKRVEEICSDYIKHRENHIVVIEGYGFARVANLEPIITIGTFLRRMLWKNKYTTYVLPPTSLKKFVTGKGNAKKDVVMRDVFKNWGADCGVSDEADAVGLAMAGLAFHKKIVMPDDNMLALAALDKL